MERRIYISRTKCAIYILICFVCDRWNVTVAVYKCVWVCASMCSALKYMRVYVYARIYDSFVTVNLIEQFYIILFYFSFFFVIFIQTLHLNYLVANIIVTLCVFQDWREKHNTIQYCAALRCVCVRVRHAVLYTPRSLLYSVYV